MGKNPAYGRQSGGKKLQLNACFEQTALFLSALKQPQTPYYPTSQPKATLKYPWPVKTAKKEEEADTQSQAHKVIFSADSTINMETLVKFVKMAAQAATQVML